MDTSLLVKPAEHGALKKGSDAGFTGRKTLTSLHYLALVILVKKFRQIECGYEISNRSLTGSKNKAKPSSYSPSIAPKNGSFSPAGALATSTTWPSAGLLSLLLGVPAITSPRKGFGKPVGGVAPMLITVPT